MKSQQTPAPSIEGAPFYTAADEPMKEIEIFEKYANSARVKMLLTVANGKIDCAEKTKNVGSDNLAAISLAAMKEAGIDRGGSQWNFQDIVFFDFVLPPEQKLLLLDGAPGQSARVEYLKSKIEVAA